MVKGIKEGNDVLVRPPEGTLKVGDSHSPRRHQVTQFGKPEGFVFRLHRFARHVSMLLRHRFSDAVTRAAARERDNLPRPRQ